MEAQDFQEETEPVKAQVIKAEPAALIASGTGDIAPSGRHVTCSCPPFIRSKTTRCMPCSSSTLPCACHAPGGPSPAPADTPVGVGQVMCDGSLGR